MDLRFRPLARVDFPLLGTWLAAPHVERRWQEPSDPASVEREYGPVVDGTDPTDVVVVELDGEPIGIIQRYRIRDEPEWGRALAVAGIGDDAAGIDYLIGIERLTGRGIGSEMIRRFADDTWARYPDADSIAVSVHQDNRRSWGALARAGFERIWSGELEIDDPSEQGPVFVYRRTRPHP